MLRKVFCILFICCLQRGFAQEQNNLGHLLTAMQNAYDSNSDSFEYYANTVYAMAVKQGNIDAEIKASKYLGIKYYLNGQADTAVKVLLEAARDAAKYPATIQSAYLDYAIAQVYGTNKYGGISKQYLTKGMGIALMLKDDTALADGYNRLGIMYERGASFDSAMYFYQQALHYNDKANFLLGKAYSLENIAGLYARKNDLRKALRYQEEALGYKMRVGKKIDIAMAYINVAETYDSLKQYDSAINYIGKTLSITAEIDYKDLTKYAYQLLATIYEGRRDHVRALLYYKKFTALNDSIYNETKTKQLAEVNAKYETEKKEEQIRGLAQQTTIQQMQLKQRSFLLFIVIGLFVASGIIVYLVYNWRKLKAQSARQVEINRQQSEIAREVFNAEENERKRIAADLHDGVGQLLSAALLNLNNYFTTRSINKQTDVQAGQIASLMAESYDELRSISHQMMPNALLKTGLAAAVEELALKTSNDVLAVNLEITGFDERINPEIESVIYRVIQESISNVIKHAKAKKMDVQILKDEDGISVTIEDNGKGFDMTRLKNKGMGLKNIYSRVQFHNGTVDIISDAGKGTFIAIHIPTA